jgi:hypothetical protein
MRLLRAHEVRGWAALERRLCAAKNAGALAMLLCE